MKKRHFTKEEIARALRQEETETAKNFHKNSRRAQGKSAKKGARLPPGPTSRLCGEIQLKRRSGSERGRCSDFASGMNQDLRSDALEHHCAESA